MAFWFSRRGERASGFELPVRRCGVAFAAAAMLALGAASVADAELRTGTQTDPADVPGADADIAFVRGSYDTDSGAVGITVGFILPLAPPVVSAFAAVNVSMTGPSGPGTYGCGGSLPFNVLMQASFAPGGTIAGVIQTGASGSAGVGFAPKRLPATASWSPDGRELTLSMNVGAGLDLRCFTAATLRLARSDPGDRLDAPGYFDGFQPTACEDGLDNDQDGNKDQRDPECRNGTTETDPSKVATRAALRVRSVRCGISGTSEVVESPPSDLDPLAFRFYGKLRIRVRGLGAVSRVRRGLSATGAPYPEKQFVIRGLRAGRYRVSFAYTGDKYRSASATVSRTVRVACR